MFVIDSFTVYKILVYLFFKKLNFVDPIFDVCILIQNNILNAEATIILIRRNAGFLAHFDQTYNLRQYLKCSNFNFSVRKWAGKYCKIYVLLNTESYFPFIMLILCILCISTHK